MKKNIILFGAGFYGKNAYLNFNNNYNIICFIDNKLGGHEENQYGIPIYSFETLRTRSLIDTDIIICTRNYKQIELQLLSVGIKEYYVYFEGFLYINNAIATMLPVELSKYKYYKKSIYEKNILFVQNAACIRTHKIATVMKAHGYKVFLLYTMAPPNSNNQNFVDTYDGIYGFSSVAGIVDFVENSEFDVIHSSNAPDMLTNILLRTSKTVVHDTHDMNSLWGNESVEELILEYMANTYSAGNIYTSKGVTDIARKKFDLSNKEVFTLENVILEQEEIETPYKKMSELDREIHCVYEGGINGNDINSDRYFEDIWKRITLERIHIHFYSQGDEKYCKKLASSSDYLHYEGNMGSKELVREMTKYDCGLAIFNINDKNRVFMETGTANKVYEYINSGLPVAVGDLNSYKEFVENYKVGLQIDFSKNLRKQFENLIKISIPCNFLEDNKFTMMSKGEEIVAFYERVKGKSLKQKSRDYPKKLEHNK